MADSLAPDAARADGNERLDDLVAGTMVVSLGLDETGEALALIGLQDVQAQRSQSGSDEENGERVLHAQATQEEAHDGDGHVGESGAEVRLGEDHQHGKADEQSSFHDVGERALALASVGEVLRHGENEDELNPFGGLKVHAAANLDPAARAQVLLAKQEHGDERSNGDQVHPRDLLEKDLVVDAA